MAAFPAAVVHAAPIQAATAGSEAFDETTAAALAKAQGARVEVSRLRTETDQVFKNPDGSTTRDQYLEPVRVRRGAAWVPVDSTLTRAADGSLVPAASAVDMVFSPGGTGPMVSIGRDGVGLALSWPTSLPAPTVRGATAMYAEVFPGVDLLLTSVGTSFTEHLIVKNAAAGQQPAVRSLTLGTRVSGGRLLPQAAGGFEVVDRGGRPAWSSPAPQMWDSSADTSATAASAPATKSSAGLSGATPSATTGAATPRSGQDGAREGDTVKAMGQRIGVSSMLLTADATLLDAASTRYPVTIDPTTGPAIYRWAEVDKTYPTTSYYNFADADQGVGYQDFSGVSTKRLFFAFDTGWYLGRTVTAATFSAFETYSGTCNAGTVDAYLTESFGTTVTWNTQPAKVSVVGVLSSFGTKAGRATCYPGGYLAEFDVADGLKNRMAGGSGVTTIGLEGRSETDISSWMRFAGPKNATVANRPHLSVTYNSTPSIPATAKMFAPDITTTCGTTAATSKTFNQTSSAANLIATGADPDGGNLSVTFRRYSSAGVYQGDNVVGPLATTTSSGTQFKFKVPATWGDGSYYWMVQVSDGAVFGPWSAKCYITLDKTAPSKPSIDSATFTQDTLIPLETALGSFTMAATGATSFQYAWNGGAKTTVPVNGTSLGLPAWIGTLPLTSFSALGALTVTAIDAANNPSPVSDPFFVKKAVAGKLAEYPFNDPTATVASPAVAMDTANDPIITAADAPHYAFNLETAGVAWGVGRFVDQQSCWDPTLGWVCPGVLDRSLSFGGLGEEAVSPQRPVASERSFTVGAWVRLTDDSVSRTLIAQNLDVNPRLPDAAPAAFDIGYDASIQRFVFHVITTITSATGVVSSGAAVAADVLPNTVTDPAFGVPIPLVRTEKWVYLAGIYDSAAGGTIRLDAVHQDDLDPPGFGPFQVRGDVTTATALGTAAGATVIKAGMGDFRVGDGSVDSSPWSGQVDNLSIWQQALSDSPAQNDVLANANANQPIN
jgi:hypothetical protein